jgi:hypothetical protein
MLVRRMVDLVLSVLSFGTLLVVCGELSTSALHLNSYLLWSANFGLLICGLLLLLPFAVYGFVVSLRETRTYLT